MCNYIAPTHSLKEKLRNSGYVGIPKELEDIYKTATELRDRFFPEVKKYIRDARSTTITLMRFLIQLEEIRLQRAKGMRESLRILLSLLT